MSHLSQAASYETPFANVGNKVKNLRLTVEALRATPLYDRARQKHEQELRHAESVVETIQREGYWDGRIHNTKTNPR